ncbi:putative bifunctional diguanylate cyclase/phosphodiesterase [Pleomorphomonas oryzae]|uniref:putative bifunctional diguanylate cyclase/phosphodiesterase n=1 Tax=Pleomorphomonas oryzae TaxID=261934 RepID=UPI00047D2678|nr:EAL domain-containing protein [Pleomorphomonas oryzae]
MDERPYHREIRAEQLSIALNNLPTTLISSVIISTSGTIVLGTESGYAWIPWWLVAVIGTSILRGLWLLGVRRSPAAARDTERCLGQLRLHAFLAGLTWAAVPVLQIGHIETMSGALTAFLMAGISAGALIQSMTLADHGIVFFTPILLATAATFLAQGNLACGVVGANTLLLLTMMIFQAQRGSARFCQGEEARLSSLALAKSVNESNRKLDYLANHDSLTGLHNRAAFNAELAARQARGAGLALAVIDLDNFKLVNDTRGHLIGDKVLIEAATRISRACQPSEFIARLGGDEFAIIIDSAPCEQRAEALSKRVVAVMGRPFVIDGVTLVIGASIGLALFPQDAAELTELFAAADIALYAAKDKGKHQASRFDADLRTKLERSQRIEAEIGDALTHGLLNVVFQGQHNLTTGAVIGHETLIRWAHPELGAISPAEILSAVRSADMGDQLTEFVAKEACRLLRALTKAGDTTSTVAINISPAEFLTGNPVGIILEIIDRFAIRPERFEVEVTEETIHDLTGVNAELNRLMSVGVKIAIDDFGAGHSSLVKLASLPFDKLKIDRCLISGIDGQEKNAQLIATLIGLGKQLNFTVLAEGVETAAEAETLRRLGCAQVQGFHFSRPVPAQSIVAQAREEGARTKELRQVS